MDPDGGNRAVTRDDGPKPSPSDALRTAPSGLFADSCQIRDAVSQGGPGHLLGKYFKPNFFWKEVLRNFCLDVPHLCIIKDHT